MAQTEWTENMRQKPTCKRHPHQTMSTKNYYQTIGSKYRIFNLCNQILVHFSVQRFGWAYLTTDLPRYSAAFIFSLICLVYSKASGDCTYQWTDGGISIKLTVSHNNKPNNNHLVTSALPELFLSKYSTSSKCPKGWSEIHMCSFQMFLPPSCLLNSSSKNDKQTLVTSETAIAVAAPASSSSRRFRARWILRSHSMICFSKQSSKSLS